MQSRSRRATNDFQIPVPESSTNNDIRQCIFCCETIFPQIHFSQLHIPEIMECIPQLLNFHPQDAYVWIKRSPKNLLCPTCGKSAAEGHQLIKLLSETQKNLDRISSQLKMVIQKSYLKTHCRDTSTTTGGFLLKDPTAEKLRNDLVQSLQLKSEIEYDPSLSGLRVEEGYTDYAEPEIYDGSFPQSPLAENNDDSSFNEIEIQRDRDVTFDENNTGVGDSSTEQSTSRRLVRYVVIPAQNSSAKFGHEELNLLLRLYKQRSDELTGGSAAQKKEVWEEIAVEVSASCGISRNGSQCRRKIKNYKYTYGISHDSTVPEDSPCVSNGNDLPRLSSNNGNLPLERSDTDNNPQSPKLPVNNDPDSTLGDEPVAKKHQFTDETWMLISLYEKNLSTFSNNCSLTRRACWEKIARKVSHSSNVKITAEQCRRKIKNLKSSARWNETSSLTAANDDSLDIGLAARDQDDDISDQSGNDEDQNGPHCKQKLSVLGRALRNPNSQPKLDGGRGQFQFSDQEISILLSEHKKNSQRLTGCTHITRRAIWEEIAASVSSVHNVTRTREQCRKKLKNVNYKNRRLEIKRNRYSASRRQGTRTNKEGITDADSSSNEDIGDRDDVDPLSQSQELSESESEGKACTVVRDRQVYGTFDDSANVSRFNFTDGENSILLREHTKYSDRLSSKSYATRRATWEKIARSVSSSSGISRTVEQCRKKVKNLKYAGAHTKKRGNQNLHAAKLAENIPKVIQDELPGQTEDHDKDIMFTHRTMNLPNGDFQLQEAKIELLRCDIPLNPMTSLKKSMSRNNKKMKQLENLKRISRLKKRIATQVRNYSCAECSIEFSSLVLKNIHMRTMHPTPELQRHDCPIEECQANFKSTVSLECHIKDAHGGQMTHFCNQEHCGRGFFTEASLQCHMSRFHDESIKKFKCQICPAKFRLAGNLTTHMDIHQNEKKFMCEFCSVEFRTKMALRNHQAKVHGKSKELYTCPKCGSFFAGRDYVRRHMLLKHPEPGQAPLVKYPCKFNECSAGFYTPEALRRHTVSVHSDERNFQCHRCPSSFKHKHLLDYHLKRHDGLTSLQCPYCSKSLANKKSLKNHVEILHEPKVRIRCEDCGEGFPSRKYYNRHRLICAQGYKGVSKRSASKTVENESRSVDFSRYGMLEF